MPWALLLRVVARIAAGLFVWRLATSRRGAYRTANGAAAPPVTPRSRTARLHSRATAAAIREGAVLGWRVALFAALLIAAIVLLAAGATLSVLTPRWLGGVLLGVALLAVIAATLEARVIRVLLDVRRRRQRGEQLVREL